MRLMTKITTAAILALAAGAVGAPDAHAIAVSGTASINLGGFQATDGVNQDDLSTALSNGITLSFGGAAFNSPASLNTGDFTNVTFGSMAITSASLSLSTFILNFTSANGSFAGTVSLGPGFTSGVTNTSFSSTNESISLVAYGTFTPAGAINGLLASNADLTLTLNETGPSLGVNNPGSLSGSATLAAPALQICTVNCNPVPEPASLSLLGAGLVGLGAVVRRRSRKTGNAAA